MAFATWFQRQYSGVTPGEIHGTPENISYLVKPSSFGNFYSNFGEHGASEPGLGAKDKNSRIKQAKDFVTGKYSKLIPQWREKCKCYAEDI